MARAGGGAGSVVLLRTSARVATGLLSWPAWRALRAADQVFAAPGHPLLPYLADAGVDVVSLDPLDAATDRVATLLDAASEGKLVVWIGAPDSALAPSGEAEAEERLARELGQRVLARLDSASADVAPEIEVLPGSYDLPGATLLDLVAVMNRLRGVDGCPWDRQQTHASLVPHLLEEAYETVEAVEEGDPEQPGQWRDALREELGDVLLQVAFHARIASENTVEPFDIDDVANGIVSKLIHRHPHVFARTEGGEAATAQSVLDDWERRKAVEKGRTSAVDGVPLAQPALALAAKLVDRAVRNDLSSVVPAVSDSASSSGDQTSAIVGPSSEAELGALLLNAVAAARRAGLDPERALRAAARGLRDDIKAAEAARRG
jgi:XTP/dITP diphosphohydrolase